MSDTMFLGWAFDQNEGHYSRFRNLWEERSVGWQLAFHGRVCYLFPDFQFSLRLLKQGGSGVYAE
jgi:hypothetical protein